MADERHRRVLTEAGFTPREQEVFWLVSDRLRNREIAARLHISERTVESHVAAMLRKVAGSDRGDLVAFGTDLRARGAGNRPLPQVLSSFVGREGEVAELAAATARHRLVTVVGPAGVGKTRLAFEVGRARTDGPEPILVDLATVSAPEEVARSVATALGLVEDDRGLLACLRAALREDRHWLLLDNCEHVGETVALLVGDLLSATSGLSVLATSQGPLGLPGELVHDVAPLGLPPPVDDPAAVLAAPAARLFAERAATASPGFEVAAANARDIAAVCRRLDGLPLAIELAAARVRMFSPAELAAHLDERFQLLGSDEGPARHRSLLTAVQWSHDLLDEVEQVVFRRCAVFPGEFDYDTAAAVVVFPPVDRAGFARAFPRLLDRSLLSRRQLGDETTAYRLLETFRAFALGQLHAADREELEHRHAAHHVEAALARSHDLRGDGQAAALQWFERRWVDLREAVRRSLARDESELAWTLLTRIGRSWDAVGIRGELFDWLAALLERAWPDGLGGVRARIAAASLLFYVDAERSAQIGAEALALVPDDEPRLRADAELTLGWALGYVGERTRARAHLESARAAFRRDDDAWLEALALQGLGHAARDPASTVTHLQQAATIFASLGDEVLHANCLNIMASRAMEMGEHGDRVERWLVEALDIAQRTGNAHERIHAELHLARLAQRRGHHEDATATCRALLPVLRRMGDRRCAARCLIALGRAALAEGETAAARTHLGGGVVVAREVNDPRELAEGLRLLALVEHGAGEDRRAADLLEEARRTEVVLGPARLAALPDVASLVAALEGGGAAPGSPATGDDPVRAAPRAGPAGSRGEDA